MLEDIVARILSDADAEAQEIIHSAEKQAEEMIAQAQSRAAEDLAATEEEAEAKAKRLSEGRAASARLDSAKIVLAEKRLVLDAIYELAYRALCSLSQRDTLALFEKLLEAYAEAGDEIVTDKEFSLTRELEALPVIKRKGLRLCTERREIGGGFLLKGKICDKDLSYRALLEADRSEYQAEIAHKLFRGN